jgi:hypothetical protein
MGMEEEAGICLAGAGRRGLGQVRRKSKGQLAAEGGTERADRREGARQRAIILGHLAEGVALGVPRAWGAPCWSQTPARPGWCGKGVSSCSPVLFPHSTPPTQSCSPLKCPKCIDFF